ncbi:chemotaxis protein CheW [Gemmobacter denitrificans]|uniref:Chemotaxis protein CheW n=1 Tax=Gemmobacter denitrificans TaxID=3123040 RepID=A0ABU8BSI1_9RHOB
MLGISADIQGSRREVVAFRLGEQDFCIDIGYVREIRGWTPTTVIPHAEPHIKGVINLRGSVVAVVDLSARLSLGETTPSPRHVVIIVSVNNQIVGLLAEVVSDILSVTPDMVKPVPEQVGEGSQDFISAIMTMPDGRMLRALELTHILPMGSGIVP